MSLQTLLIWRRGGRKPWGGNIQEGMTSLPAAPASLSRSDGQPESASKVPCTGTRFLAVLVDGIPTPRGCHSLAVLGKCALHSSVGWDGQCGEAQAGRAAHSTWSPWSCCSPRWATVLARWLQWIWRSDTWLKLLGDLQGEPKTKVSEPGASLLQPSPPGCEW